MSHYLQVKRKQTKQKVVVETAPEPSKKVKAPAKKAPAKAKAPAKTGTRATKKKTTEAK